MVSERAKKWRKKAKQISRQSTIMATPFMDTFWQEMDTAGEKNSISKYVNKQLTF